MKLSKLKNLIGRRLNQHYTKKGRMVAIFADLKDSEDAKGLRLVQEIKGETDMLLKHQEAFLIYKTVKKTEKIAGDIAEVGVYKGGSAKLIREATSKTLHLFDTFEGLPETTSKDNQQKFKQGELAASLEGVQDYLKGYSDVYFYKGLFPETSGPVENKKFSFVHLDVDLYKSTLDCLDFFYPRMTTGGVIMSHNYRDLVGVRKAFDEFFKDKPEIIIEPSGTSQALVVKTAVL
ncbi:TylF/MycF family methyltransferase [Candidatus Parcubacteria bacterium]|nr:TylF/MycF family methyltransferase [Candidatus Parcubacteria bacterium]